MLADEAGMRAAHDHLERRCAALAGRVALLESRTENLLAALAIRDGVPVAVARIRYIPDEPPPP